MSEMNQQSSTQPPFQLPKFTEEDTRILNECRRESFYYRCIPFAAVLSAGTTYAIKAGYLKASPRFGVVPKVLAAVFAGYAAGKLSYADTCSKKFINSPNSDIGAALRSKKCIKGPEGSFDSGEGPHVFANQTPSAVQRDTFGSSQDPLFTGAYASIQDLDTTSPKNTTDLGLPVETEKHVSYDELRQQNREEFERNRRRPTVAESGQAGVPVPLPQRPAFREMTPQTPKNKYGDTWEG